MTKYMLTILLMAIMLSRGFAQPDTARIEPLLRSARSWLDRGRMDSAIRDLKQTLPLIDTSHFNDPMYRTLSMLAECHLRKNEVQGRWYMMQLIGHCHETDSVIKEAGTWYMMGYFTDFPLDSAHISLYSFQQAARLYQQAGQHKEYIQSLTYVADRMIEIGEFAKAESYLLEVLEFHKTYSGKIFPDRRYVHFLLAEIYRYKGDYNKALDQGLQITRIMENGSDSSNAERYYGELAMIYQQLGQSAKSVYWYRRTIEKREADGFTAFNLFRTAGLMIQEMIKLGQAAEALSYMTELQRKYKARSAAERATLAQSLGYCYDALQQFGQAERSYLDMIRQYGLAGLTGEFMIIADYDIANFYVRRERYQLAVPYLRHALEETHSWIYLPGTVRDIYFMLYRTDSASGDYKSAISHLRQYQVLNDSLVNEKKIKDLTEMEVKYESDKKDKDLLLQQSNIQILGKKSQLQIGGILLLLIIIALLFSRYRLQQRSKRQLEASQKVIQRSNIALQDLVEEKEWLLKEIHHRVKNNLQVIMSLLSSQSVYLDNDAALFAIRDSQRRVQAISLIHQRLYQTENVSSIDMNIYIRELVHYLKESFSDGRHIVFDLSIADLQLDVSHAVPIGLILNEAITNAIKYAFPGERDGVIRIELGQQTAEGYYLNIADDGIGMSPEQMQKRTGSLGMSLMRGLSEELGGQFNIVSSSDGTLISITFQTIVHE